MDPEQLRRTIVRATLPRIGEYATLTTAQIAQAADVGEAELLAVFPDKEAVLQACAATLAEAMTAAMNPDEEVRQIAAIGTDQPLASRLVAVLDIFDAYRRRVRTDLDALLIADIRPSGPPDDLRSLGASPELRQAVAKLLEPEEQRLRLPAQVLAEAFVGMTFGGVRPAGPDQPPVPAEQVVDLFLHGALTTE